MTQPIFRIRCLRAWTAHNASYSPGEEYRVPEFIARILKRGGYDVTDELLDRMYLKAFKSAIDAQIKKAIQ